MIKKYRMYIISLCIVVLLLPIAIDRLIIGNNYFSNISNESWVSFLGSYCGAIIGAIATILGIGIII